MSAPIIPKFPKRFFWGASTSSHQVEGNTHNNWSVWELENAKSLASAAPYKVSHLPVWPQIKDEAEDPRNYVSGIAADHYRRYELDFDIAQKLNFNAFRFSIEWSRIEPEEGKWDLDEIEHYRRYIQAIKKRGMEPFITLYHWVVPTWFSDRGGFEHAGNVKYFVRFAEKILQGLGSELRFITTINEPDTVSIHGYITLEHPPQRHSMFKAFWVYRNLLKAHKDVYKMGKKMSRRFKIGFTKGYAWVRAGDERRRTKWAVRADFWLRDDVVLGYVGRKTDFIGLNYYFSDRHIGLKIDNTAENLSDLGWEMRPEDLEHVLKRLWKRHKTPIIITESGVADRNDAYRQRWILKSIMAMDGAMKDGVEILGYLHWALIDNFEWAYGRWPRFGLVEIDYDNDLKRKVRKSAMWYGQVIKKMRGL